MGPGRESQLRRLGERYNRPACVVAVADGVGKDSGRSVAGVELGAVVLAARRAGLLTAGGLISPPGPAISIMRVPIV